MHGSIAHANHGGINAVRNARAERYWFPMMSTRILDCARKCESCARNAGQRPKTSAAGEPRKGFAVLEAIQVDLLSLAESRGGHKYVILAVDRATGYATAAPAKNKEATTVARFLAALFMERA